MAREQEAGRARVLVEEKILLHDLPLPDMVVKAGTSLSAYERETGDYTIMHFTGWFDVDKMYFETEETG